VYGILPLGKQDLVRPNLSIVALLEDAGTGSGSPVFGQWGCPFGVLSRYKITY
jgi:hypothetical protein